MYRGTNATALQSQKLMIGALLSLMEEEPFAKITIKSICARAMVSRQTFYTLFDSKEEVIGLHLDQLFEAYVARFVQEKRDTSIRSLCEYIAACLVEQKTLVRLIVENRLDVIAKEKTESYLSRLSDLFIRPGQSECDYAIAFLAGALMNVTVLAVRRNDFGDGTKLSNLFERILTGSYFGA